MFHCATKNCPRSAPGLQELSEADADKLAALLERRLGKPFEQIELEDMTPEVVQEVRHSHSLHSYPAPAHHLHACATFAAGLSVCLLATEAPVRVRAGRASVLDVVRLCSCGRRQAAAALQDRLAPFLLAIAHPHCPQPSFLQLRAAAGMDKAALEDQLAAKEESILVEEFRRNLEYNLKKVGRCCNCFIVSATCTFSGLGNQPQPGAQPDEGGPLL